MRYVLNFIFFSYFCVNLSFANDIKQETQDNIMIKPVIYFDEDVVTNIDLKYYEKIISIFFPEQDITQSFVKESIIQNLSKKKYYKKYNQFSGYEELKKNENEYLKNIETNLNSKLKVVFLEIKNNPYQMQLLKDYLFNEIIWTSIVNNNLIHSINIDKKEVDVYLKTHSNKNTDEAYQSIAMQKLEPVSRSILEQIKNFTYIKYI